MSPRALDVVLNEIIAVSRGLMEHSLAHANRSPPTHQECPMPLCIFPQPQPLMLDAELGIDNITAYKLSSVYLRAAEQLQGRYRNHLRMVFHNFVQSGAAPHSTTKWIQSLHSIYVSMYMKQLRTLAEEIGARTSRAKQRQPAASPNAHKHPRRLFSQQVIAILEAFFEHNAFPSRLEKHDLAVETNMKYSQVHIWFQNRRSRCRKEGKELKKGDPVNAIPSELETSVIEVLALTNPDIYSNEACTNSVDITVDIFNLQGPPHAFPSAYPTTCSYDPFPIDDGARKFITPWIRKPSSPLPRRSLVVDITQLTASFMRMTLADDTQTVASHTCSEPRRIPCHHVSYALGFNTIVPSAPHPALIPAKFCDRTATQSISVEASWTNTPGLQSTASVARAKKSMSRRKVAPLPKRIPTSASVAHYGVSPAVSQATSPSSMVSNARLPLAPTMSLDLLAPVPMASDCSPISATPRQTPSRRKVAPLPKRAPASAPYNSPPSPQFVSTPSRTPSASSLTSSRSSSPSGPDSPLSTPPYLPAPLPSSKTTASRISASDIGPLFIEPSTDGSSSVDGLQLQLDPLLIASHPPS